MKVKTLVAMVVSSILAVSFSYAAAPPQLQAQLVADDATSSQPSTNDATANPGAMDGGNPTATPSDAGTSGSGTGDSTNGVSDSTSGTGDSSNTGSDEESQDQATGDSDY